MLKLFQENVFIRCLFSGPANVVQFAKSWKSWLEQSSDLPKLYINAHPGFFSSFIKQITRDWPNHRVVEVKGHHFLQEDSPDEIGRALRDFLQKDVFNWKDLLILEETFCCDFNHYDVSKIIARLKSFLIDSCAEALLLANKAHWMTALWPHYAICYVFAKNLHRSTLSVWLSPRWPLRFLWRNNTTIVRHFGIVNFIVSALKFDQIVCRTTCFQSRKLQIKRHNCVVERW